MDDIIQMAREVADPDGNATPSNCGSVGYCGDLGARCFYGGRVLCRYFCVVDLERTIVSHGF